MGLIRIVCPVRSTLVCMYEEVNLIESVVTALASVDG